MTTVGDAIKTALDDNWAGSGGTEPALYSSEDVGKEWPTDDDWIKVLGWTYRRKRRRRNDTFIGERYLIDLLVHSMNDANSEERLDTIVTEIYRIINPTNVTGFHLVDIVDESRAASDDYMHFMATLTVELTIKSTSAAVTPGSGGDGDVAFPADVTVAGDLDVEGWVKSSADNEGFYTGAGDDLRIYHTGSFTLILNATGEFVIRNTTIADAGFDIRQSFRIRDIDDSYVEIFDLNSTARTLTIGQSADTIVTTIHGDLDPGTDKTHDMGTTGSMRWDDCYADDWHNESSFKRFTDPLLVLQAFKPTKEDEYELDHSGIDEWLKARIKEKPVVEKIEIDPVTKEETVILVQEGWTGKYRLKDGGVGNYADGYQDEDFEHADAYSINKTQLVIIQALQQLETRLKKLEAKE